MPIAAPTDLSGLTGWYEAADLALANGAAVTTVADKSGLARTATQGTVAAQPTYVTTGLGGRGAIRFDGVDDYLAANAQTAAVSGGGNNPHTLFVVGNVSSVAAGTRVLVAAGSSTSANPILMYRFNAASIETFRRSEAVEVDSEVKILGPAVETTAGKIYTFRRKQRATGVWVDGTLRIDDIPQDVASLVVDRFAIGALLRSTPSAFFAGDISEIVLYDRALTAAESNDVEAYLAGKYGLTVTARRVDGPLLVADHVHSWWSVPLGTVIGPRTYVGGVSKSGTVAFAEFGDNPGEKISVGAFGPDDHNAPVLLAPADKPPVAFYSSHGSSKIQYRRIGTVIGDINSLGYALKSSLATSVNYQQPFRRPATDEGILFCRTDSRYWGYWRTSDYFTTLTAFQNFIDYGANNQGYINCVQMPDGNLRVVAYGHPTLSTFRSIYYCTINLATGDVTKIDGTVIANIKTNVGLPLVPTSLDLAFDVPTGTGSRLFGISDGPQIEISFATWTTDDTATTVSDAVYRVVRHDGVAWSADTLIATGRVFGYTPAIHYVGAMTFPRESPGGVVFLARENSGRWSVERWARTNGVWGKTSELASSTTNALVRPYAMRASDPHPLVFTSLRSYGTDSVAYRTYDGDMVALSSPPAPTSLPIMVTLDGVQYAGTVTYIGT